MKELKKEAFKKAKEFFCGASLKQNFRAWAVDCVHLASQGGEKKRKRSNHLYTRHNRFVSFLDTQIRAQQLASAAKGERRQATFGRQASREYKSRVRSSIHLIK